MQDLYWFGEVYGFIFLLINLVLMLNFVIAILSNTFAKLQPKILGLHYEIIVSNIPKLEFDVRYGCIICSYIPMNFLTAPLKLLFLLPMSDQKLIKLNSFICHIIYFPVSVVLTISFCVSATLFTPFAYINHIIRLIDTLTNNDETMDEISEKLRRFQSIVLFVVFGPFILVFGNILDFYRFWINLYSKPYNIKDGANMNVLSQRTIEIFVKSCNECASEIDPKIYKDNKAVNFVTLNKKI